MENLVSIIITVFNKENYIHSSFRTVLTANYPEKEIIVVDDCSTDRSPEIIAEYCSTYPFIRSIRHETNQRMSVARNTGLAVATGKYVQFWDADDSYDPDGMGRIVAEMEEDGSDIGTGIAFRNGLPLPIYEGAMHSVRATTLAEAPVAAHNDSACFKVYRRDFLLKNGLRFAPGLYLQDIELNLRAMPLARKITVTPYRLGEYVLAENSASKGYGQARFDSALEVDRLTREFYRIHDLQRWEPFRQARIVSAVFRPFLAHALRQVTTGYTFTGGHSHYIDGPDKAWAYLDRFRKASEGLIDGIRLVSETDPGTALAFVCLLEGAVDQVLPLLRGRLPCDRTSDYFPSTEILSRNEVADGLAKLGHARSELTWIPAC